MDRFNIYFSIQTDDDYYFNIIQNYIKSAYYYVKSRWKDLDIVIMTGFKKLPYLEMRFSNDFYICLDYNDGKYNNLSEIKILKSKELSIEKNENYIESLKMWLTCLISGFIYLYQNLNSSNSIPYYGTPNYYGIDKYTNDDITNYKKIKYENNRFIDNQPNNKILLYRGLEEEIYDNIIDFFVPNNKYVNKEYIINEIKRKIKDKNIEMYNAEIAILKNENNRLSKENEDLNERLNRKIVDIKNSITGGDSSIPQHNSLYEQFINFREQDISSLQALLKMRLNIRQRALFMRSIAQEIFKDEMADDNNIGDIINAIEKSIEEIKIDGDVNFTEFTQGLEEYVNKGIKLAKSIKLAKPQGYFLWVKNGAKFDSSCNQTIQGCDEGDIELTAYPGYFIIESSKSLRFFEKAVVYTKNEII